MRRRAITLAVAAAVLGSVQAPAAQAAPTTVVLTSTLVVGDGDTVREQRLVWQGPSNQPVVKLAGTRGAVLDHLAIEVADGFHATAAIELADGAAGGPFGNAISDIRIGSYGLPSRLNYGLRWTGTAGGGNNTVTTFIVMTAETAAVSIDNPNALSNSLRGVYSILSPIGIESRAQGDTVCVNCGFIGSTIVDIKLLDGAGLLITGMYSEEAHAFADITAGPGGGGLSVTGGYWMWNPHAVGTTSILGRNTAAHRTFVRLTDFMVTPLDSACHGSIAGFQPGQVFIDNAWGITNELVAAGLTTPFCNNF